jgi:hypothetical protein
MSGVPVREQWKLGKAHINPVPDLFASIFLN